MLKNLVPKNLSASGIAGIGLTILSIVGSLLMSAVESKQMERMVEEKVNEALDARLDEEEEES